MTGEAESKEALVRTEIPGRESTGWFEVEQKYMSPGVQTISSLIENSF